jgi:hypothetical protein
MRFMRWQSSLLALTCFCGACSWGQELKQRPAVADVPTKVLTATPSIAIPLTVPLGTPLKVALDQEVRVREAGQSVHGKITEPVYAFDKLVIPAGSEVTGRISEIGDVSKKARTMAAANGNFSPAHQVHIEFDELKLADGSLIPLHTVVTPASPGVLQFVAASEKNNGKPATATNAAHRQINQARQQVRQEWEMAKAQLHEPGKKHRLERYALAQLPVHPQYLDSGASFNSELQAPLNFGGEMVAPEALAEVGTPPPSGSTVHAQLVTPLSSATSKKGDLVEAVVTQPLFDADRLVLPQGSRLKGSVLQVHAARRLGRNGQLRIVFHELTLPSGLEQKIQANLEGVAVAKNENLALDSEGGAQVTTPRTRYLTTAIAVALATTSMGDSDGGARDHGGDAGSGAANGASGFKFLGTIIGTAARSRAVSSGLGFYGAGFSVYEHFLTRGRDVVYPKDMSMLVSLGGR